MIINGIWVWEILEMYKIYCWKELVLDRKKWKKFKVWLQTHVGQNLSTLSWHDSGSLAQCYSLPFPSNGLVRGHVPDRGHCQTFVILTKYYIFDPYMFVWKKKKRIIVHKKRKKIARKKLIWRWWFAVIVFSLLQINVYREERRCEWESKYLYLK